MEPWMGWSLFAWWLLAAVLLVPHFVRVMRKVDFMKREQAFIFGVGMAIGWPLVVPIRLFIRFCIWLDSLI